MKQYIIGAMAGLAMVSTAAVASVATYGVSIVSVTHVYETVKHYEDVEVCTKGKDRTTEGAIIGGLIGNDAGGGDLGSTIIGALIGGALGDAANDEVCTTERRVSHTSQNLVGYDVTISSPTGKLIVVTIPH